ncbi:MAG TPA: hypothetical protein VK843_06510 [Planctomycetota bacterium]|nr:hypothetical protein [Planctomycetota bacterium]
MKSFSLLLALCAFLGSAGTVQAATSHPVQETTLSPEPGGRDWIVKAENNICGLSDATQLSNPVVVDFAVLLDATPEYKKMKDQKISSTSPEGIKLNNEAVNRIATQCESIRASNGYCSVWKEIKHRDGRTVTDVTDKVKALL